MRPISLSDAEMDAVYAACAPLEPDRRGGFLQALAAELQGKLIGPGTVHRAIVATQRRYYDPPLDSHALVGPRHSANKLNSMEPVDAAEDPRSIGRRRAMWARR
jgi:hypothetical protein